MGAVMPDLAVLTDCTDPAVLYAAYRDYTARYERMCDDIDEIDRQLRSVVDRANGQRLTAEMCALNDDSAILLGWIAAAFAAYIFASHGHDAGLVEARASSVGIPSNDSRLRSGRRPSRGRR